MAATKGKTSTGTKKRASSSKSSSSGRKKSSSSKSRSSAESRQAMKRKPMMREIQGIILFALALFFAFAFFTDAAGIVGAFIKSVCYGLFGAASTIFFVYFIIAGINCFTDEKSTGILLRTVILLGLMICTSIITALFCGETHFIDGGVIENLMLLYDDGINASGGGIIGGGICAVLCALIGTMGTWVFAIAGTLVLVILLTGISVTSIFKKLAAKIRLLREELSEQVSDGDYANSENGDETIAIEDVPHCQPGHAPAKRRKKPGLLSRIFSKNKQKRRSVKLDNGYGPAENDSRYDNIYGADRDGETTAIPLPVDSFMTKNGRSAEVKAPKNPSKSEKAAESDIEVLDDDNDHNIKRFSFDENEDLLKNLFSGDSSDLKDLPFDPDNIVAGTLTEYENTGLKRSKLPELEDLPSFEVLHNDGSGGKKKPGLKLTADGVLTERPDEDGNIPKPPSDDPLDFEPPSEAKMQDKLDPATKAALDMGVPIDEAVVKGRKMVAEGELTPQQLIEEQAAEKLEQDGSDYLAHYKLPPLELLSPPKPGKKKPDEIKRELEAKANSLLETLANFKVDAKIINITQGPTVTRFELQPGIGVKVSKITGLADDIALSLAATGIIFEAPIPGKAAIGIEIPNDDPSPVPIREVLTSEKFKKQKSKTTIALGKDISGNAVVADISDFPHVLIAGATGSGKSVCINSIITSILYKARPDEVKLIMIDPKMVELGVYNGIPHLLIPVVTDPKHAAGALNWAVVEMQNRYNLLKDNKVRNLKGYNKLMDEQGTPENKLPEIVIIIDELADLMIVAKNEVEDAINRLAALARAAGMYLVIATQRPSVNVITGVIKANVPSRISFAVSSQIDSRTIIDTQGAEKLLGKGDMLYYPRGAMRPIRVQGNFVSDKEIENIVDYIKNICEAEYDDEIIESIEKEHERVAADLESAANSHSSSNGHESGSSPKDDMFLDAVELVLENGQASVAMFQRKFKMGYQRAAKLIDQMEERKIIGPYEGTKPRQVLITRQEFNEMKFNYENRSE